jgi:hypothetical protein
MPHVVVIGDEIISCADKKRMMLLAAAIAATWGISAEFWEERRRAAINVVTADAMMIVDPHGEVDAINYEMGQRKWRL